MKNKSIIIAALCLIALVGFSGCAEEEVVEEKKALDLYVGGTDGVVGKFNFPAVLTEGQLFDINFEVENKGEEEVLDGELHVYVSGVTWGSYGAVAPNETELNDNVADDTVGGFVDDLFYEAVFIEDGVANPDSAYGSVDSTTDLLWKKACYLDTPDDCVYVPVHNYLASKNLLIDTNYGELTPVEKSPTGEALPGGTDELLFDTLELAVPDSTQGQTIPWGATLCYPYKTRGAAQVCIGEVDVRGEVAGQCVGSGDKYTDASGGPIQITKINEVTTKGNIHTFTIHFENKGSGQPYIKPLKDGENCISDVTSPEKGRVIIENITLDGEKVKDADIISCKFGKDDAGKWIEQRLTGTSGRISCRLKGGEAVAGLRLLEVTLQYNYYDSSITKEYTIEGF